MKYANSKAFEKHLEGSSPHHFAPIYLILSKDRFLRKNAVELVCKAVLAKEKNAELQIKTFDEENLSASLILSEIESLNLFADKRVITIDLGDKATTNFLKEIQHCVSNPTKNVFLVISASTINASTTFYKQAEKNGVILEIAEEKAKEKEKKASEWVIERVVTAGKNIDLEACHYLVKQIGSDPATLHQEVSKLLCFVEERSHITLKDVGLICSNVNTETIWQLGEALFQRKGGDALRISKALVNEGTPFLSLVRQIRNQFQTDYTVSSILASGGTHQDISQKYPYMKGFILDLHIRNAQAYGTSRFRKALLQIDELELMAKNSAFDQDLLTELLVIKLMR